MSLFNPKGILQVVGVILALIALYLVLEKAAGATSILGAITTGAVGIIGDLQGRTVTGGGYNVGNSV